MIDLKKSNLLKLNRLDREVMVALATIHIPWIFVLEHGPEVYSGRQFNMRLETDLREQLGQKVSKQVHFHLNFTFHFLIQLHLYFHFHSYFHFCIEC